MHIFHYIFKQSQKTIWVVEWGNCLVVSYEWVINLGIGMQLQTSCATILSLNWV